MKVGDRLEALWSDNIMDHVTKGEIYEVCLVSTSQYGSTLFMIKNDKGKRVVPVSVTFTKISEE
jgi:hypothetical protein